MKAVKIRQFDNY